MAKFFDAPDPGFRIMSAMGFAVLCAALVLSGARLVAAAEVEVNLDVLKTLPAGKSGAANEVIKLTPPTAKSQAVGRREEALRRARKRRLIEQAKRKAAARRKAEAARKAEDAKQSEEIERKAKADREDAAARAARAPREAEATKTAEATKKASAAEAAEKVKAAKAAHEVKAAKAAQEAKAAKAAQAAKAAKAAKAHTAKPAVIPRTAPVKEAAKATTKTKAAAGGKKQVATRTARVPLSRARLLFGKESAALSKAEKEKLGPIAARMISEEKALLVIYAYAAGDGSNASDARRLSLSRALAVRRAITGRGIPMIRTEIRALGARAGDGPSDRVDLVLVQR